MIYSSACAHAIRAMSHLAMLNPDEYVLIDDLCKQAELPRHFVAKIFQQLVKHELLNSAKGRGGGFSLAFEPDDISLWDIIDAVDGTERFEQCVVGMAQCDDKQPCPQHDQFKALRKQIKQYLQETTLAQMGHALERKLEEMARSGS